MNKFKFGDKVWHEGYGECSVLILDDEIDNIYKIVYLDGNEDYIAYAHESKLTLVSDWVKCSERMPEHDGFYLTIMVDVATNEQWQEIVYLAYGKWSDSWQSTITHWMPLPAPPQD